MKKQTLYGNWQEVVTSMGVERWLIVSHYDTGFFVASFSSEEVAREFSAWEWSSNQPHLRRIVLIDLLDD